MMNTIRNIILTIVFFTFICSSASKGQKLLQKKADYYYDIYAYSKAVPLYKKLLSKDSSNTTALRNLAVSYCQMGKTTESEKLYASLLNNGDFVTSDIENYGTLLRKEGKYKIFEEMVEKYADSIDEKSIILSYKKIDLEELRKDSAKYKIQNLEKINTPFSEFAPSIYKKSKLVFASSGFDKAMKKTYKWNGQPFLNLYYTRVSNYGKISKPRPFIGGEANTKFHEGAVSFDKKGKQMYFTRNNYKHFKKEKGEDETMHLVIFKAKLRGRSIEKTDWLEINNRNYSTGHPSLSPDGKILYFASNRPGGFGGTDLWYSIIYKDSIGQAINMGNKINTAGDEMFPFIHQSGDFYFASDGLPGFGGLDIFLAEKDGDGFDSPQNMGYPVNTNFDDFSYILEEEEITGFFASNRPGGKGDDDIYSVTFLNLEPIDIPGIVEIPGVKSYETNASFVVYNAYGEEVKKSNTNNYGQFTVTILKGQKYTMEFESGDYIATVPVDLKSKKQLQKFEDFGNYNDNKIVLHKKQWLISGKVIDTETDLVVSGAKVILKNTDTNQSNEIIVAEDGKFSFPLQENQNYSVTAFNDDYFGSSLTISTENTPKGKNYDEDLYLNKLIYDKAIKLDNIYYDYRKWNIRQDAAQELDRLVEMLRENKTIKIELGSHTDCRGDSKYNANLSQKRAQAAVNYIVKNGISRERVTAKGYGEKIPVNHCVDGVECEEDEHQENRRTEFKIISKD